MVLDKEPSVKPKMLQSLISQAVSKATQGLKQEIKLLKEKRGATPKPTVTASPYQPNQSPITAACPQTSALLKKKNASQASGGRSKSPGRNRDNNNNDSGNEKRANSKTKLKKKSKKQTKKQSKGKTNAGD
jgi:hypothetical protein